MTDIYDDYADKLTTQRHETRAAPMLDLVSLALEYGYEPTLSNIYFEPIPDPNDEVLRIEQIIMQCAIALAGRLGVGLNPQVANHKPKEVVRIIHGLTGSFEEFEDTDTLYGIVLSGEPAQFILENMIRYVYGDDDLHVEDLITNVEPRVLTVMENFLAATSLDGQGEVDVRTGRVANYLRTFPQNPSAWVFMNLPPLVDLTVLTQSLDFADDNGLSAEETLVIYSVGLTIAICEDYDTAYTQLEKSLEMINNDDEDPRPILEQAIIGLKTIYGVAENEQV